MPKMHLSPTTKRGAASSRSRRPTRAVAAIRGRADVIVTGNVRDFPEEVLRPFGIDAQHPDEFTVHLLDLSPGLVLAAAQRHRESLKNPAKTVEEYLEMLEGEGLAETVAIL